MLIELKCIKKAGLNNQQLQLAEQQQLRFYNIFAKVFHKNTVIKLIQKVAPVAVSDSTNYGRSAWFNAKYNINLDDEFFAESFARWILTPQNQRDWGWELENSFFLHYLPMVL